MSRSAFPKTTIVATAMAVVGWLLIGAVPAFATPEQDEQLLQSGRAAISAYQTKLGVQDITSADSAAFVTAMTPVTAGSFVDEDLGTAYTASGTTVKTTSADFVALVQSRAEVDADAADEGDYRSRFGGLVNAWSDAATRLETWIASGGPSSGGLSGTTVDILTIVLAAVVVLALAGWTFLPKGLDQRLRAGRRRITGAAGGAGAVFAALAVINQVSDGAFGRKAAYAAILGVACAVLALVYVVQYVGMSRRVRQERAAAGSGAAAAP